MGPVGRTAERYGYKRIRAGVYRRKNEHWPNQIIKVKSDGSWTHISPFKRETLIGKGQGPEALNHRLTLWHERH